MKNFEQKNSTVIILAIIILLSPLPGLFGLDTSVKVGVYDNKPLAFTDSSGDVKGFIADIIEYIAEKENWNVEYFYATWPECLRKLENGNIDILGPIAFTKERSSKFNFNTEALITNWGQVYIQEGSDIESFLDLEGKTVGILEDDIHSKVFRNLIESFSIKTTYIPVKDYLSIFKLLDNKSIDAGVVNRIFASQYENKFKVAASPIIFNPIEVHFATPKKSGKNILGVIDREISVLKANPGSFYYRTLSKWFFTDTAPAYPFWIIRLLIILTGLLIIAAGGSIILKFQIKARTMTLEEEIIKRKKIEEDLNITLDSIGEGVIAFDKRGIVTRINPAAEAITGWSREEAEGKYISEVFITKDDKTEGNLLNPEDILRKTEKYGNLEEYSILVSKTGDDIHVFGSAAPIHSSDGNSEGGVLVFRDITEKLKTEAEQSRIKKLESIALLAGGIAHDFNNILTGLFGNIEIAKLKLDQAHPSFHYIETAYKAFSRAASLTEQLFTLSRGGNPAVEPVDLKDILVNTVEFNITADGIEAVFDLAENLKPVKANKGQINRVISNLIINAVQAMPDGGRILISAENTDSIPEIDRKGSFVKFSIKDEGYGISNDNLDKIFDPYFTTKETGNGLGLATVYAIILKYNGHITVSSSKNNGTVFTIYLPAQEPEMLDDNYSEQKMQKINTDKRKHILIIEDDDLIRDVLSNMLEACGHSTETSENLTSALDKIKEHMGKRKIFDIIIMDLSISGIRTADAVVKISSLLPEARIIITSGNTEDEIMVHNKKYGFAGILPKPFQIEDLKKVIYPGQS